MPSEDTQFKPGKPGGPGRGKGTLSLTTLIKQKLAETPEGQDPRNYAQILVDKMVRDAISFPQSKMAKLIWNYIDGMPKGSIDLGADKESLAELTQLLRGIAKPDVPGESEGV